MSAQMTLEEMAESLTGYEEIAIEKATGDSLMALQESHPTRMIRALVALDMSRRDSCRFPDAYKQAMEMPFGEVMGWFQTDSEPMPDDPITESGKGGSPDE